MFITKAERERMNHQRQARKEQQQEREREKRIRKENHRKKQIQKRKLRRQKKLNNVRLGIVLILLFSLTQPSLSFAFSKPLKNCNITFQPSVISELRITFVEEFFRVQWLGNHFDLKLLVGYSDSKGLKEFSLHDFWEKTNRRIEWIQLKNKATESMYHFGYNVTDIPKEIADNTLHLVWKIEGASFDEKEIKVEVISDIPELEYNITRFHLPDNLVLSYEDMWLQNYTVKHPNKLETIVEGMKGQRNWSLDPILFSSGIITAIGGGEGSELTFKDLWDADQANGWNVVHNNNNTNVQFQFDCGIVLGNGTVEGTTWFADTNVQVVFSSSASANNIYVKAYAHFRLGELYDATNKLGHKGVHISTYKTRAYLIRTSIAEAPEIELYGSTFWSTDGSGRLTLSTDDQVYNCILDKVYFFSSGAVLDLYDVTIKSVTGSTKYPLSRTAGTINKILVYNCYYIAEAYDSTALSVSNIIAKNVTRAMRCTAITTDKYLINVESNSWVFYWAGVSTAEVYRQYTFNLCVYFPNGTAIQNANVTITHYGQATTQDYNGLTDATGSIPEQTLSKGFYNQANGDTLQTYEPYNLQINNVIGYNSYNGNFTLSEETDWTITLTPEKTSETTDDGGAAAGHTEFLDEKIYSLPITKRTMLFCLASFILGIFIYKIYRDSKTVRFKIKKVTTTHS